ncbi:MAG: class I SAM-dependent methyltransferase [Actinomycetota bacterium]|nr:class I SAM-dependent methyltransferase [Actinomycetota bacterium]
MDDQLDSLPDEQLDSLLDEQLDSLLTEQIAYYRARAPEYDATGSFVADDAYPALVAALEAFVPRGRVLELACGTGQWTAQLARHATHLTALDASAEMIALNRTRVGRGDVEYVEADVFAWSPSERYDVVFFSAWLSHVPPQMFERFWSLVARCLGRDGRAFAIDELPAVEQLESRLSGTVAPVVERRLSSGESYRTVKVFYDPVELETRLNGLGWRVTVRPAGWRFFYLTGTPAG